MNMVVLSHGLKRFVGVVVDAEGECGVGEVVLLKICVAAVGTRRRVGEVLKWPLFTF